MIATLILGLLCFSSVQGGLVEGEEKPADDAPPSPKFYPTFRPPYPLANFGVKPPVPGYKEPEPVYNKPEYPEPEYKELPPHYEEPQSYAYEVEGRYGTQGPDYVPPQSDYEEPAPIYEVPPSTYEDPTPVYEVPIPQYKEPTPVYKEPTPVYEEPVPEYKEPTPAYKEPTPVYEEPLPEYKKPTPEYKEPVPPQKPSYPIPSPHFYPYQHFANPFTFTTGLGGVFSPTGSDAAGSNAVEPAVGANVPALAAPGFAVGGTGSVVTTGTGQLTGVGQGLGFFAGDGSVVAGGQFPAGIFAGRGAAQFVGSGQISVGTNGQGGMVGGFRNFNGLTGFQGQGAVAAVGTGGFAAEGTGTAGFFGTGNVAFNGAGVTTIRRIARGNYGPCFLNPGFPGPFFHPGYNFPQFPFGPYGLPPPYVY